jgi:hypothetical protein
MLPHGFVVNEAFWLPAFETTALGNHGFSPPLMTRGLKQFLAFLDWLDRASKNVASVIFSCF